MSRREPDEAEILHTVIERRAADWNTHVPGIVRKYDAVTGLADVEVAVQNADPIPMLMGIPVKYPGSSSLGAGFSYPVVPGDEVTVVFHQVDPTRFRVTGSPSQAELARRFGLYAEAWPSPYSDGVRTGEAGTAVRAGYLAGNHVAVTPAAILLGGDTASQALATANLVLAELNKIKTAFAAWVPVVVPAPGSPDANAVALKAAIAAVTFTAPASTLVKATS